MIREMMTNLPPSKISTTPKHSAECKIKTPKPELPKAKWIHDCLHPYKKINERYRNRT